MSNVSFSNNNISADDIGIYFYCNSAYGNPSTAVINNLTIVGNNITSRNTSIYICSRASGGSNPYGLVNNTYIFGNNIISEGIGINITAEGNFKEINNTNISFNRIVSD